MGTWSVFDFLLGVYNSLSKLGNELVTFFNKSIVLDGTAYSVFELMFGAGFIALIGFVVVKFILDIVL